MLILIYGADSFRVRERVAEMRQKFLEKFDPTGMNLSDVVVRVAADANIGEIGQQIRSAPFLALKRMVIVGGLLSIVKKADVDPWRVLLGTLPDDVIVILHETVPSEKVKKLPLFLALDDARDAHSYVLDPLVGAPLRGWLLESAQRLHANLPSACAEYLIARTGGDAWQLHAELMKLASFARGESITREMIDLLCGASYSEDVFGLLDALASDPRSALERLSRERKAGADEFPLFGMLVRQIRLLLAYRLYIDRTGSSQGVTQALGIHSFVAQKLGKQAEKFTAAALLESHARAQQLDRAMKRGLSAGLAVDRLVVDALKRPGLTDR
ncbi:MAG: polymerase III subunit delta protein [Candidatus Uhrbacteria bacterium GW2011_GWD2_52_7]|uniref:DNA-directed DNA polymerase n=1 Tax=Candidatus Uhrbacteria bacterium GW2011_GWD2_52_7 TaxID=1618989 RepID=A0A0G1XI93_9BACT|nr:MAG: polymerase III subunit delta protein [Candidatus Uhrbacteria bacterium GW2011_GWD2_52_7]